MAMRLKMLRLAFGVAAATLLAAVLFVLNGTVFRDGTHARAGAVSGLTPESGLRPTGCG